MYKIRYYNGSEGEITHGEDCADPLALAQAKLPGTTNLRIHAIDAEGNRTIYKWHAHRPEIEVVEMGYSPAE